MKETDDEQRRQSHPPARLHCRSICARRGEAFWLPAARRAAKFGWFLEPSRAPLSDTSVEQGLHVFPVERLLALLRKSGRNCCQVEVGAITLGQQVEAEEVARAVAFVDGRNRTLGDRYNAGLCRLPFRHQFGVGNDVEAVQRRGAVQGIERAQG